MSKAAPKVVATRKAAQAKAAGTGRAKAVKAPSAKTVPKAPVKAAGTGRTKAVKAPSAKVNAPKAASAKLSLAKPGSGRPKTTSAKAKAK